MREYLTRVTSPEHSRGHSRTCTCREYLALADEANHADALFDLGDMHARGADGATPNPRLALRYFVRAAAQVGQAAGCGVWDLGPPSCMCCVGA